MATLRPFKGYRPRPEHVAAVAAKPYDVLSSEEARREAHGKPLSFLHVGKPEIDLPPDIDLYDPRVYQQGKANLQKLIADDFVNVYLFINPALPAMKKEVQNWWKDYPTIAVDATEVYFRK